MDEYFPVGGWQALSFLNYLFTLDIEVSMDNTTPLVTD
jgi:hypothetical protein